MKRVISLALSIVMLLSITAGLDFSSYADTLSATVSSRAATLRSAMKSRQATLEIDTTGLSNDSIKRIFTEAVKHTGVPDEGDYLFGHLDYYSYVIKSETVDGKTKKTTTYTLRYRTTYSQEQAVTKKIAEIKKKLKIDGKSDHMKLCEIYDYICSNVMYDYDNLYDPSYILKQTCYAALIDQKAVCQGYALLLYRLCLEYGIDSRVIYGMSQKKGDHAWNIVKLDGKYYLCDSTWDAGDDTSYRWFLNGKTNFTNHVPDDEWPTSDIMRDYDIPDDDYPIKYGGITYSFNEDKLYTSGVWQYKLNYTYKARIIKYTGTEKNVVVPSEIDGYTVTIIGENAFENNSYIETVTISEGVRKLSDVSPSFSGCQNLKTIVIPSTFSCFDNSYSGVPVSDCASLKAIDVSADNRYYSSENGIVFNKKKTTLCYYPPGIESKKYVIPNSVDILSSYAFAYQQYVEEIEVPDSVKSIGIGSFFYCEKLKKVNIPSKCTFLGSWAFSGSDIEEITVPNSITNIAPGMFMNCKNLKKVKLPSNCRTIGNYAFAYCHALEDIELPENLNAISGYMFFEAYNLKKISIPSSCDSIGNYAFAYCHALEDIEIPDSVKTIGEGAFYDCVNIKNVTIPYGVTSIGEYAFGNCNSLRWIEIPSNCRTIGYNAFAGTGIEEIELPENLNAISGYMFFEAYNLKKISIPSSCDSIGNYAFAYCHALEDIEIPDSVKTIGEGAFYDCVNIKNVTIPYGVTSIGEYAFGNCNSLRWIEIPSSVTSIASTAFSYYSPVIRGVSGSYAEQFAKENGLAFMTINQASVTGSVNGINWMITIDGDLIITGKGVLESDPEWQKYKGYIRSITIGEGIEKINADFSNYNATSLTLPESLTEICDRCFEQSKIKSVNIPKNVSNIGYNAFGGCNNLESINVSSENQTYSSLDGVLFNKDKTRLVQYPNGKTATRYTVPDGVKTICNPAFWNCKNLTEIVIPDSVEIIEGYAFAYCNNLKEVYYEGSEIEWKHVSIDSNNEPLENAAIHYGRDYCKHKFDSGKITTPVTCTTDGVKIYTCTICNETKTEIIKATGHNVVNDPAVEPTCTTDGKTAGSHCSLCNAVISPQTVIKAYGHSYTSVVTPPTEFSLGYTTYTCTKCGYSYVDDYTQPLGHNYIPVVTAPTCTEYGYTTYTCEDCGDSYISDYTYPTGHSYTSVVTAPTDVSTGYTTYTCTKCGYSYVANYTDMLDHDYQPVVTAPTCTEYGYTTYICKDCGDSYTDSYVSPLGHVFSKNVCTRCGYAIPAITEGKIIKVNIENGIAQSAIFTPTVSGRYTFESFGNYDTYVYLLDSDGNMIEYNDDDGEDSNYKLDCYLEAGKIYELRFGAWDDADEISYDALLTLVSHTHNYESITCTECGEALPSIALDETKRIDISNEYGDYVLAFTPTKSGEYVIESFGSLDTRVWLYDKNWNELAYNDDVDYGNTNFYLSAKLEANVTYIFKFGLYSSLTGSFDVKLSKAHVHSYNKTVVSPTCTAKGYTLYSCKTCDYKYKSDYTSASGHVTTNVVTKATTSKDGKIETKCTVCGKVISTKSVAKPSTFTLSTTSYTYDGKEKKPSVTIKDSKGNKIASGNYSLKYSNNKAVGKASVKITFKGNYSGSKTLSFTINPKGTTISSLTASSKGFTAKWKKQATQTTGYQIQYSTSSKFTNAKTVTVSKNSTTSTKVTKLTAKKKYYVRIRTYKTVSGTKYYSSWSGAKSVTTK